MTFVPYDVCHIMMLICYELWRCSHYDVVADEVCRLIYILVNFIGEQFELLVSVVRWQDTELHYQNLGAASGIF